MSISELPHSLPCSSTELAAAEQRTAEAAAHAGALEVQVGLQCTALRHLAECLSHSHELGPCCSRRACCRILPCPPAPTAVPLYCRTATTAVLQVGQCRALMQQQQDMLQGLRQQQEAWQAEAAQARRQMAHSARAAIADRLR